MKRPRHGQARFPQYLQKIIFISRNMRDALPISQAVLQED